MDTVTVSEGDHGDTVSAHRSLDRTNQTTVSPTKSMAFSKDSDPVDIG